MPAYDKLKQSNRNWNYGDLLIISTLKGMWEGGCKRPQRCMGWQSCRSAEPPCPKCSETSWYFCFQRDLHDESEQSQFQNVTDRNLLTNQTVNQCSVCFIIVLLYIFIITIWLGRLSTLTLTSYGLWIWVVYWPSETSAHTDFHSFAEILISKSSFIAFSLKHEQDGRDAVSSTVHYQ